jgi:hypothetical protein
MLPFEYVVVIKVSETGTRVVIVETVPPEQVVVMKDSVTGTWVVTTEPPGSVVVIVVCKAEDPQIT